MTDIQQIIAAKRKDAVTCGYSFDPLAPDGDCEINMIEKSYADTLEKMLIECFGWVEHDDVCLSWEDDDGEQPSCDCKTHEYLNAKLAEIAKAGT